MALAGSINLAVNAETGNAVRNLSRVRKEVQATTAQIEAGQRSMRAFYQTQQRVASRGFMEQSVRDEMATRIKAMRAEAMKVKVGEEVQRRLFGVDPALATVLGSAAGRSFGDSLADGLQKSQFRQIMGEELTKTQQELNAAQDRAYEKQLLMNRAKRRNNYGDLRAAAAEYNDAIREAANKQRGLNAFEAIDAQIVRDTQKRAGMLVPRFNAHDLGLLLRFGGASLAANVAAQKFNTLADVVDKLNSTEYRTAEEQRNLTFELVRTIPVVGELGVGMRRFFDSLSPIGREYARLKTEIADQTAWIALQQTVLDTKKTIDQTFGDALAGRQAGLLDRLLGTDFAQRLEDQARAKQVSGAEAMAETIKKLREEREKIAQQIADMPKGEKLEQYGTRPLAHPHENIQVPVYVASEAYNRLLTRQARVDAQIRQLTGTVEANNAAWLKQADTIHNIESLAEGLGGVFDFVAGKLGGVGDVASGFVDQVREIQKSINDLRSDAIASLQSGLTGIDKDLLRFQGNTQASLAVLQIQKLRDYVKLLDQSKATIEAIRTPQERYQEDVQNYVKQFAAGFLSPAQLDAAVTLAQTNLRHSLPAALPQHAPMVNAPLDFYIPGQASDPLADVVAETRKQTDLAKQNVEATKQVVQTLLNAAPIQVYTISQ